MGNEALTRTQQGAAFYCKSASPLERQSERGFTGHEDGGRDELAGRAARQHGVPALALAHLLARVARQKVTSGSQDGFGSSPGTRIMVDPRYRP